MQSGAVERLRAGLSAKPIELTGRGKACGMFPGNLRRGEAMPSSFLHDLGQAANPEPGRAPAY